MESKIFSFVLVSQIALPEILSLLFIIFLLVCSALVSGSEVALFSLKPSDFEVDETKMSKGVYLLNIEMDGKNYQEKIVVQ